MLTRRVRFACCAGEPVDDAPRDNAYAGWPSTDRLAVTGEFVATVHGVPDPTTGYLVSVADIDVVVRARALPIVAEAIDRRPPPPLPLIVRDAAAATRAAFEASTNATLRSLALHQGPYFSVRVDLADMTRCILRQSFEFAAAHRLHCPELDDAANRRVFGKCNNANGHGHNYRLEVGVRVDIGADGAARPSLRELERAVRIGVIDRLDHTHLNEDVPDFAAVNPSVENIAAHCHGVLRESVARLGGELAWVTLWETEKTACTIGDSPGDRP